MILDGARSKQSFRFADSPVFLLFEEVPESRNFIPKKLFQFQGYEELMSLANTNYEGGDDNPGHGMPGAGAVTTDPSKSVERGHDNNNRPNNHVMVESLPGTVTEQNGSLFHLTCLCGVGQGKPEYVHSAKKPHHG